MSGNPAAKRDFDQVSNSADANTQSPEPNIKEKEPKKSKSNIEKNDSEKSDSDCDSDCDSEDFCDKCGQAPPEVTLNQQGMKGKFYDSDTDDRDDFCGKCDQRLDTDKVQSMGESKDETDNETDEEKAEKFLGMSDTDRRNLMYNLIRNKIDNQALIIDERSNMKWIDQCTNSDEIYAALSTPDHTCTTFALLDVSTVFPNVVLYYDEEYLLKHSKSSPNNMATDLFRSFNQGHWLYGSVLLTHSS
jgi:hypothetical protein